MKKIIYIPIDAPRITGDEFTGAPTFDRAAAIVEAKTMLNHLTGNEKKLRHVYVGVFTENVDPDISAYQAYILGVWNGTWNDDHDVIEITEESGMDAEMMSIMVDDYLADHAEDDDPLVLSGEPYIDESTGEWTQNAHDREHSYTLVARNGNIILIS